jgi:hypothetical protein
MGEFCSACDRDIIYMYMCVCVCVCVCVCRSGKYPEEETIYLKDGVNYLKIVA